MDALECIKTRRSVRRYTDQPIDEQTFHQILEAAISGPSSKNGQPWKFKVVTKKSQIELIADLSVYGLWMKQAARLVMVFLDHNNSFDYLKDVQSCGAVMQNMMLAANALDIGSCWNGELLAKMNDVKSVAGIENENMELMGIVSFGYKAGRIISPGRKTLELFLL